MLGWEGRWLVLSLPRRLHELCHLYHLYRLYHMYRLYRCYLHSMMISLVTSYPQVLFDCSL